jgi:uncharacterized hydrophobic protein (TIGR00271 family)
MAESSRSEVIRSEEGLLQKEELASHQSYYILLSLSAALATFALISNNPTVESGAMVISPLMTPLSALAVGLAEGKARPGMRSLIHLSWSIIAVVAVSFAVSFMMPIVDVPELIASRSQPTLHDLLIAIVAGAIGMYGYLRKDISTHLAGVAAAVSLEPPLAVMGMSLAEGYWPVLWGAAALFLTNVVAIVAAAAVVLLLLGKHPHGRQLKISLTGWTAVGALLVALSVFLGQAFWEDTALSRTRRSVREVLKTQLGLQHIPLDHLEVTQVGEKYVVRAQNLSVREDMTVSPQVLRDELARTLGDDVELHVSYQRVQSVESSTSTP